MAIHTPCQRVFRTVAKHRVFLKTKMCGQVQQERCQARRPEFNSRESHGRRTNFCRLSSNSVCVYTHARTHTQINVKTKIIIVRAMLNVGEHRHVWSCQESVPPQTPTSRGAQARLLKAASREHEGTAPSSRGLKPTAPIFPMKVWRKIFPCFFLTILGIPWLCHCGSFCDSISTWLFFFVCLSFQGGDPESQPKASWVPSQHSTSGYASRACPAHVMSSQSRLHPKDCACLRSRSQGSR